MMLAFSFVLIFQNYFMEKMWAHRPVLFFIFIEQLNFIDEIQRCNREQGGPQ